MVTASHRHQRGQAIVLGALVMTALIAGAALILMAGMVYWDRRELQGLADSAALAGAIKIGLYDCASSPSLSAPMAQAATNASDGVISAQVGASTGSTFGGACSPNWTATYTHPGSLQAIVNFPYHGDATELEVVLSHDNPLQFGGFLGNTTTIRARAVAKHVAGSPGGNFAIFARANVSCQGTAPVVVTGSIYSTNAIGYNGQCAVIARAINDSGFYRDYGNIVVYADNQAWGGTSAFCGAQVCADGYELSGHLTPSCGSTGISQYLDPAQLSLNPNPCSNAIVPAAPYLAYPTYIDPNTAPPNPPSGACSRTTNYGSGPPPGMVDGFGFKHFNPGCYTTLDVAAATPNNKAVLEPGFYYFNGGGICLQNKAQVLGKDITLEFVNSASFSSDKCQPSPTGSCGTSSSCGFGSDPGQPPLDGFTWFAAPQVGSSSWCTGSCPSGGLLIYYKPDSPSGSFYIQGPGESSWFKGSIFWPGPCTWQANGTSTILGQLVCQTVALQGGTSSTGGAVQFATDIINVAAAEAALVE